MSFVHHFFLPRQTNHFSGILFRLVDARANEMNVPMVSRDWGMLGQMAFGRCGQLLFSFCALVDLYGGLLSGVIVASNQLQFLFPSLSAAVLSVGCFGVLLILVCVQARRGSPSPKLTYTPDSIWLGEWDMFFWAKSLPFYILGW